MPFGPRPSLLHGYSPLYGLGPALTQSLDFEPPSPRCENPAQCVGSEMPGSFEIAFDGLDWRTWITLREVDQQFFCHWTNGVLCFDLRVFQCFSCIVESLLQQQY